MWTCVTISASVLANNPVGLLLTGLVLVYQSVLEICITVCFTVLVLRKYFQIWKGHDPELC